MMLALDENHVHLFALRVMKLTDVSSIVAKYHSSLDFLRGRHILRRDMPLCYCGREMTEIKRSDQSHDLTCFRCLSHKGHEVSVRDGSLLKRHNISLGDFILVVYLWAFETPNNVAAQMIGLSQNSHTVVFLHARRLLSVPC